MWAELKKKKSYLIHKTLIPILFYRLITFRNCGPASLPQSLKGGKRWTQFENQSVISLHLLKYFFFKKEHLKAIESSQKTKPKPEPNKQPKKPKNPKQNPKNRSKHYKKKNPQKSMKSHWSQIRLRKHENVSFRSSIIVFPSQNLLWCSCV